MSLLLFDEAILLKYQTVGAQTSIDCRSRITPEQLAQQWCIGLQTAAKTLMTTTQKGLEVLSTLSTDASEQGSHSNATHNGAPSSTQILCLPPLPPFVT